MNDDWLDALERQVGGLEGVESVAEALHILLDEAAELHTDLAIARAQRDATQKALDKANRDNDELRRQIAALREAERARPLAATIDPKRLVDGGEGVYSWMD